jgi:hypothetical protein
MNISAADQGANLATGEYFRVIFNGRDHRGR